MNEGNYARYLPRVIQKAISSVSRRQAALQMGKLNGWMAR